MYQLIDGKELSKNIRKELKLEADELRNKNIIPKLAVILVGNNSASKVYIKNKSRYLLSRHLPLFFIVYLI